MFPHNSHYTAYEVSLQDSGPLTWAPPSQPTERTAALPPRHAPGFQAGFRGSVRSSEMYSRLRSRAPLTLRQLSVRILWTVTGSLHCLYLFVFQPSPAISHIIGRAGGFVKIYYLKYSAASLPKVTAPARTARSSNRIPPLWRGRRVAGSSLAVPMRNMAPGTSSR